MHTYLRPQPGTLRVGFQHVSTARFRSSTGLLSSNTYRTVVGQGRNGVLP